MDIVERIALKSINYTTSIQSHPNPIIFNIDHAMKFRQLVGMVLLAFAFICNAQVDCK